MEKITKLYVPSNCSNCQFRYEGGPYHPFCFLFKHNIETGDRLEICKKYAENDMKIYVKFKREN